MKYLKYSSFAFILAAASPALAEPLSQSQLEALVQAQAAQIDQLQARLDRLETAQATQAPLAPQPQQGAVISTRAPMAQTVPTAPAPTRVAEANSTKIEWGQGLPRFTSPDGNFTFKPRGRIQADVSSSFGSDFDARNETTTGMRGLRLGVEGTVGDNLFYQFESDFAGNDAEVVTAFIGWKDRLTDSLNYDIRLGQVLNDRSFEGSTGSDATPFLDRSVVSTSIIPQRGFFGVGAMGRLFWDNGHASLQVSGDPVDGDQSIGDSRTIAGRVHLNPIKGPDGILHLGIWGFDEDFSDGNVGTLTRNTSVGGRFNPQVALNSGPLTGGTGTQGYGLEVGGFKGPLWAMGEFGERRADLDQNRSDMVIKAWSLSAGWFLTGEAAPYSASGGTFTLPKVTHSVFDGGRGALELTGRYEDLAYEGLMSPADGWAGTLGANWYLNNITKLQLNLIHWQTDNSTGAYLGRDRGQTLSGRVAITF